MFGIMEAPRAWGLTQGMARVLGLNLPGAVIEGWLTRDDLADLVDRCQACGKSTDCVTWLARMAQAPALPGYCSNKAEIEALAPGR